MELNFTTDPYTAWGTLLGTALGQMYNNNAQKRERAKADRIIDDVQNQRAIQRIADARRAGISDEDAVQVITNKIAQQEHRAQHRRQGWDNLTSLALILWEWAHKWQSRKTLINLAFPPRLTN